MGSSHHGLGAYAASKAALNRSIQAWRTERPDRRFVCMKIGDTGRTDVARDFDLERAQELFAKRLRAGLVSGRSWTQTISVKRSSKSPRCCWIIRQSRSRTHDYACRPVMAPDQIDELMASVSMKEGSEARGDE